MTIVPRAVASFAGFDRIQTFLLRPSLSEQRTRLSLTMGRGTATDTIIPAIQIQHLTLGKKYAILKDIDIEISHGLTIVSGPTGSGKSTLLRAILGEITPSGGSVNLSTQRIAYCAQKPWLPSGSIRETIQGCSAHFDEEWYQKVIDMCCLTHDLKSHPAGDETQIGSRGLNLSGGQRQRVVS